MNQKMRKQLKRVVPVTLAVIVLAGFIFGAIGMMAAYAAESKNKDYVVIDRVRFLEGDGNPMKIIKRGVPYDVEVDFHLTKAGLEKYKTYYKEDEDPDNLPDGFPEKFLKSLLLSPISFKVNSGHFKFNFSDYQIVNKGENESKELTFTYKLEEVRADVKCFEKKEDGEFNYLDFNFKYDDGEDELSFALKNFTFSNTTSSKEDNSSSSSSSSSSEDSYTYDDDDSSDSKTTSSEDENAIPTPKMIISSFDIPSEVAYGEEFDATIEFYNNSAYKDMVNVTMTVTPSEGVIIRNGVNQRHYIKVPKRQSTTERFRFKASDKLATESITLTVKFEYEYRFNKEYKQGSHEEVLSLVAKPKPEESSSSEEDKTGTEGSISSFELLSIVVPDKVYPDEDAYITIRAINKDHQFDASNVQVTVTGDGLLNSGNTVYHGALAHSTQAEIETTLQFASPGTYPLVCTLVYEDSVGLDEDKKPIVRINDIQKDFTVTVLESPYADMGNMGDMGDMGDMGMDPGMDGAVPAQGGAVEWMRGHLWAPIGGGIVLLAVVVGVVRHIRRKKAADDDDL